MVTVGGALYMVESIDFGHNPDDVSVGLWGFDITVSIFNCK